MRRLSGVDILSRMKRCAKCGDTKPLEEFHTVKRGDKRFPHSYCIPCEREYERNRNRPDNTARAKAWRESLSEERLAAVKNREADVRRANKYGVDASVLRERLEAQYGGCAGCCIPLTLDAVPEDPSLLKAHVDHNHSTGQVRGLLCTNCNTALGLLKESTIVLLSLVDYLKDYSEA